MIINYLSDLHLEFGSEDVSEYFSLGKDANVIVIAGDISASHNNGELLDELAKHLYPKPLIYVTGNHDYYHGSKPTTVKHLRKIDGRNENFHFLNRNSVIIDGVKFIGSTGWQDSPEYNSLDYGRMNDFHLIKNHSVDVNVYGEADKNSIELELKNKTTDKVVVITHIIPTIYGINHGTPEVVSKDEYIRAYFNDWDDLIIKYKPTLWICGHCHDSIDTIYHDTKILRNALGYLNSDRVNKHFYKHKSVVI